MNDYLRSLAEQVANETGIPKEWIWAQWMHETGEFTSYVFKNLNNFSGLKQFRANNTDLDCLSPEGDNYQYFPSQESYAKYFAFYLGLYEEDGIFEATTVEEFAIALKHGGYYGDSVENYTNALNYYVDNPNG